MTRTFGFIGPTGTINGIAYKTLEQGVDLLVDLMAREALRPDDHFTRIDVNGETYRYSGNFDGLSMVFGIQTDDQAIIKKLNGAIAANIRTQAYISAVNDRIASDKAWIAQWGSAGAYAECAKQLETEIVLLETEYGGML